ncbi:MAG: Ribonuclease P protein subunit p40 [Lichina confinis]|nr:MAG: Ribonuclease P protein subunit p40 [Lichina confinis]
MQHGRKGFKRIQWAAEKVLNCSVKWLFCDMTPQGDSPRPIDRHHPIWKSAEARTTLMSEIATPPAIESSSLGADALDAAGPEGVDDFVGNLYEWLSLVSLESPRITAHDSVDPFLSRYAVTGTEIAVTRTLRKIRWEGLLPAAWTSELLLKMLNALRSSASTSWFALNALGFEVGFPEVAHGYTLLRVPSASERPLQSVTAVGPSSNAGLAHDAYYLWEVVSA